ncbi:MAG: glycosyltransferase, partial [Duncaniella sp.]|nr:glycosyltransferase [Duncaniella sp.]
IMASASEAFGRVTVEYMMHSLAVVATDSGASEELLQDHSTGLLYPAGDIEALTQRLHLLLDDVSLRLSLGNAARQYALSHFTSRANSQAVHNLYRKLLSTD